MAGFEWWAVEMPALRSGRSLITYVQASSRQQAGENTPGSTVLGGPYPTEAAAEKAFPQGSHGTTASATGPPAISDKPVSPLGGLAAIGDFFGKLGQAATWIRVAEVIVGIVLIAVGVAKLTHAVPIATTVAKAVA